MAYGQSQGGNYAASLAYNAFLSMFPLILGMLAVVGLIVSDPSTRANDLQRRDLSVPE